MYATLPYMSISQWHQVGLLIIFLSFSIPASIIDLREFRLPNKLLLTLFLSLSLWIALTNIKTLPLALLAAGSSFLFFFGIRFFTKGLGLGDVKFAACIGLFCGPKLIFIAFLIASVAGIVVALLLLHRGKVSKNQKIPFGPFLTIGALGAWLVGFL